MLQRYNGRSVPDSRHGQNQCSFRKQAVQPRALFAFTTHFLSVRKLASPSVVRVASIVSPSFSLLVSLCRFRPENAIIRRFTSTRNQSSYDKVPEFVSELIVA